MNLINRTQANLFIQTVRGKMIASILHLVSRHLSFSLPSFFSPLCIQWFWQMLCVRARSTFVLGGCVCVCVCVCVCRAHAWQHTRSLAVSPQRGLTLPPILSSSPPVFPPPSSVPTLISCLLLRSPTSQCSPAVPFSFVSAAVTTIQGGGRRSGC